MTPAARLQCAVEALGEVEKSISEQGAAADVLLKAFFRNRRYAGSGDRRAVSNRVYDVLRMRGYCLWACNELGREPNSRNLMLVYLSRHDIEAFDLFTAGLYGPPTLDDEEKAFIDSVQKLNFDEAPLWAYWNCPDVIADSLESRFNGDARAVRDALNERAAIDIRVNTLTANAAELRQQFADEEIIFEPCTYSPWGLRLEGQRYLENHPLFRSGSFELQDEGSQLVSLMSGAKAGQTVVDLCAGAGGKTLALAAMMNNEGKLIASDVSARRLKNLDQRLKRTAISCVYPRVIRNDVKHDEAFQDALGQADIVFVDAPCSGTGTWRRHPEARWRYDEGDIKDFSKIQDQLIDQAVDLVKPGGRIIYVTCSLLQEEDEGRVEAALQRHKNLELVDYHSVLEDVGLTEIKETHSYLPECLLLSPYRHGTDGFFYAVFKHLGA